MTSPVIAFRPLALPDDLELLHSWVTHPRSHYWGMQGASQAEVREAYEEIEADPMHHALVGEVDSEPSFLTELYEPLSSELAALPEVREGDLGMHVLVAPPTTPVPGFTREIFAAVMHRCFDDPEVQRVVVEPDIRNDAVRQLNREAGFTEEREVPLEGPPTKVAALSFCTRRAFADSTLGGPR